MPKKTKKQKIEAELRRKNFLINQSKIVEITENKVKKEVLKTGVQHDTTRHEANYEDELSYFKHDFKKSLIIITIIIALEIVIYFGTII